MLQIMLQTINSLLGIVTYIYVIYFCYKKLKISHNCLYGVAIIIATVFIVFFVFGDFVLSAVKEFS